MTDMPNMKRQKISDLEISDMPDEIVLKILSYLDVKNLILCGHVSKKLRIMSHDETLWKNVKLCLKSIEIEFLQMVLNNGCKYLNLEESKFFGNLRLEKPSQLKYLNLSYSYASTDSIEKILSSCHSLERLLLEDVGLTPKMVNRICHQNGKSLKADKVHKME